MRLYLTSELVFQTDKTLPFISTIGQINLSLSLFLIAFQ